MSIPSGIKTNPIVNKRVVDTLNELGVDPIRVLAQFAKGEISDEPAHVLTAAKELAQYVHAKKKALDITKDEQVHVQFEVVSFKDVMPDTAEQVKAQLENMKENLLSNPGLIGSKKFLRKLRAAGELETPLDVATITQMREDIKGEYRTVKESEELNDEG